MSTSFGELVEGTSVLITCGPGGVGKTTTAAAIAAEVARRSDRRVLVLTIDPARRLADALGLDGIGNDERRVAPEVLAAGGPAPLGRLEVAMLDTKQSWDALVRRHAQDAATAQKILENPLYQNITGRFIQSHDYIAMERLYELHRSGRYDLIVVDTPPTRNALDFLDAPERLADFFSSRLLRWLIAPYRSKVFNLASKPFTQVADKILGAQFLADIAEFFIALQSMYGGFVERAQAVSALVRSDEVTFCVVSSLETTPAREAEFFAAELTKRHLNLGAVVFNKVLPDVLTHPDAELAARMLTSKGEELASNLDEDEKLAARVLHEVGTSFVDFAQVARTERRIRQGFHLVCDLVCSVPYFDGDVADLEGLARLSKALFDHET